MEPTELDRSAKSKTHRYGKNHHSNNNNNNNKTDDDDHQKFNKVTVVINENEKTHNSNGEGKKKKKKNKSNKKKHGHKKPHSLLGKHDADPSNLLEETIEQSQNESDSDAAQSKNSNSTTNELIDQQNVASDVPAALPVVPSLPPVVESPWSSASSPPSVSGPVAVDLLPPVVEKLVSTAPEHKAEFNSQLELLDRFFKQQNIKYWLNGGTLLGQVRNQNLIDWVDCNSIAMLEDDGKRCFADLKKFALNNGYHLWNSVHGLKLRTEKGPAATDIYFYSLQPNGVFALASDRSRNQWPKDYFTNEELNVESGLLGALNVSIPHNPTRYLSTLYGENFLTVARYSSYNHFVGAPRATPIKFVKIQ